MEQSQQYVDSCNNVLKELNVVGGGDNECTDKQGFPAWVGSLSAAAGFLLTGETTYMDIIERSFKCRCAQFSRQHTQN